MKALVLAGGYPQIDLINELHSIECYVILADYNENPVARKYADKYYQVSTLDVPAIKDIAIKEKIDFILTICTDQALHTVVTVSEALHLPCYLDSNTVYDVTNKLYMKKIFTENDISTATYIVPNLSECSDKAALQETIQQSCLAFPMIVKPANCNSSKGVAKVYDIDDLFCSLNTARKYSRTNEALIEQFISGIELTIDAYVSNGEPSLLAISVNEKLESNDKFVNFRTFNPAPIDNELTIQILQLAKSIVKAFHLKNTPLLIQILYDGSKMYVCEFSARTGGGAKCYLLNRTVGFSPAKAIIDLTLQGTHQFKPITRQYKYLVNEYIYCQKGTFASLSDDWDTLKRNQIISDYFVYQPEGHKFDTIQTCGDRIAGFTIEGNSIDELNCKQELANSLLKVWDTEHNDIMRHDFICPIDLNSLTVYK